jgi:hypothetical protein
LTTENIKAVYGVESMIINTKLGPYVITVKPSDPQNCRRQRGQGLNNGSESLYHRGRYQWLVRL